MDNYFTSFVLTICGYCFAILKISLKKRIYIDITIKPVSPRLRRILFFHLASFLHVKLHRETKLNNQNFSRCSTVITPRRMTTIYNAIFLNENDLLSNDQRQS